MGGSMVEKASDLYTDGKMKITEDPEVLQVLGVPDLKEKGRDSLDFKDVAVWALADAIEIAYQKGYAQGIEDYLRNGH